MADLHRVLPSGADVTVVFRAADGGPTVVTRQATIEHLPGAIRLKIDAGAPDDQRYVITLERPGRLPIPIRTTKIARSHRTRSSSSAEPGGPRAA